MTWCFLLTCLVSRVVEGSQSSQVAIFSAVLQWHKAPNIEGCKSVAGLPPGYVSFYLNNAVFNFAAVHRSSFKEMTGDCGLWGSTHRKCTFYVVSHKETFMGAWDVCQLLMCGLKLWALWTLSELPWQYCGVTLVVSRYHYCRPKWNYWSNSMLLGVGDALFIVVERSRVKFQIFPVK